jgi:uncharacterized OB-fold protein
MTAALTCKDFKYGYEEEGKLKGFACKKCGYKSVTFIVVCPRCGSRELGVHEFVPTGKVVSFTLQGVASDKFFNEAPFAYVVVELDDGGRLSGWMPDVRDAKNIKIGDVVMFTKTYKPGIVFEKPKSAEPKKEVAVEGPGAEWMSYT